MKKQTARSYRLDTSSLLPLKMVLTNARKTLPPRVEKKDAGDELAQRLIYKMKMEYKRRQPSRRETTDHSKMSVVNCVEKW